jgi:hypothetical protein
MTNVDDTNITYVTVAHHPFNEAQSLTLLAKATTPLAEKWSLSSLPRVYADTIVQECEGHPYMLGLLASLLKRNPDR